MKGKYFEFPSIEFSSLLLSSLLLSSFKTNPPSPMLKEILRFELAYRKKRPATYLYFGIIFLLCFFAVTSKYVVIGGVAGGQIKENSPYNLAFMTVIMTFALTFITSAIMALTPASSRRTEMVKARRSRGSDISE